MQLAPILSQPQQGITHISGAGLFQIDKFEPGFCLKGLPDRFPDTSRLRMLVQSDAPFNKITK